MKCFDINVDCSLRCSLSFGRKVALPGQDLLLSLSQSRRKWRVAGQEIDPRVVESVSTPDKHLLMTLQSLALGMPQRSLLHSRFVNGTVTRSDRVHPDRG